MGSQPEEVDWDRLDKGKMFIYGAGMFSGVTLALYPLSVIKTKQMTLPGISGGFQGVRQTAATIMRLEGVPGFYRGFGTVIFGTIPARGVYLTTLEWTKSETSKVVSDLGLTGPAAAGIANFAGGALASLATQSVTVPIDVISQKQMVHGDETVVARHQHSRTPLASTQTGASSGTAAAGARSSGASTGPGAPSGLQAGPSASAAPQGSVAATGAAAEARTASSGLGQTTSTATGHARTITGTAGASGASVSQESITSRPSSHSLSDPSIHHSDAAARGGSGSGASSAATASSSGRSAAQHQPVVRRIGALQMVRLIAREEGFAGFYRGFGASVATFVPSSAVWWGAYGAYQKLIWALLAGGDGPGQGAESHHQHQHSTGEVMTVQTASSVLAGCTSSLVTTPLDLVKTRIQVSYKHDGATPTFAEVTRQILREDGPGGFLRGAVPRMINASLWGTCMVTVYEYLKRISAKDEP